MMYLDFSDEQKALRQQLRDYFGELFTPALVSELATDVEGGGPEYRRALQRMGADGWLGIGWPKEFGGQGRPAVEQHIFFDEVQRAGFPIPFLTLNTVGPTLVKFGTDEQRALFLPRILRGELHFSIGYTEPEAGTDLASLRTTARRDGDCYVVNGQKVFTSLATHADYIWLAVRTDANVPKHKGISILIVDRHLPGVSITPVEMLGDNPVCTTYYEDVRVPASCLVGRENEGWKLITNQLNHERIALSAVGPVARLLDETVAWAKETRDAEGARVIDRPWARQNLARVHARLEILKLLNWQQACKIDAERSGKSPERNSSDSQASRAAGNALLPAEASAVKVYGSELYVEAYRLLLEVLGPVGAIKASSPGAQLQGRLERYYRATLVLTFGGGTNEVQREIIATTGLGMPRSR